MPAPDHIATLNDVDYALSDFINTGWFTKLPEVLQNAVQHVVKSRQARCTQPIQVNLSPKTVTVTKERPYVAGDPLRLIHTEDPSVWLSGRATGYDPATGALSFQPDAVGGSGTHATWLVVPDLGGALDRALVSLGSNLNTASTTNTVPVQTGSRTLTVSAWRPFQPGQFILATDQASPARWIFGQLTAVNQGAGTITLNVTRTSGVGTPAGWTITGCGPEGLQGVTLQGQTTVTATQTLANWNATLITLNASADDQVLTLPSAATLQVGTLVTVNCTGRGMIVRCQSGATLFQIAQAGFVVAKLTGVSADGTWELMGRGYIQGAAVLTPQTITGAVGSSNHSGIYQHKAGCYVMYYVVGSAWVMRYVTINLTTGALTVGTPLTVDASAGAINAPAFHFVDANRFFVFRQGSSAYNSGYLLSVDGANNLTSGALASWTNTGNNYFSVVILNGATQRLLLRTADVFTAFRSYWRLLDFGASGTAVTVGAEAVGPNYFSQTYVPANAMKLSETRVAEVGWRTSSNLICAHSVDLGSSGTTVTVNPAFSSSTYGAATSVPFSNGSYVFLVCSSNIVLLNFTAATPTASTVTATGGGLGGAYTVAYDISATHKVYVQNSAAGAIALATLTSGGAATWNYLSGLTGANAVLNTNLGQANRLFVAGSGVIYELSVTGTALALVATYNLPLAATSMTIHPMGATEAVGATGSYVCRLSYDTALRFQNVTPAANPVLRRPPSGAAKTVVSTGNTLAIVEAGVGIRTTGIDFVSLAADHNAMNVDSWSNHSSGGGLPDAVAAGTTLVLLRQTIGASITYSFAPALLA
ncbi:MAG TPA: hypothetical protein VED40_10535 [Azospirillaceae bacterium]|nr:hypothetical protein [Azospirillaceae bacterium]